MGNDRNLSFRPSMSARLSAYGRVSAFSEDVCCTGLCPGVCFVFLFFEDTVGLDQTAPNVPAHGPTPVRAISNSSIYSPQVAEDTNSLSIIRFSSKQQAGATQTSSKSIHRLLSGNSYGLSTSTPYKQQPIEHRPLHLLPSSPCPSSDLSTSARRSCSLPFFKSDHDWRRKAISALHSRITTNFTSCSHGSSPCSVRN